MNEALSIKKEEYPWKQSMSSDDVLALDKKILTKPNFLLKDSNSNIFIGGFKTKKNWFCYEKRTFWYELIFFFIYNISITCCWKLYLHVSREHYWDWNNDNLGVPDLGQINVTFPDWKIKQIRRAYYSSGMAAGAGDAYWLTWPKG